MGTGEAEKMATSFSIKRRCQPSTEISSGITLGKCALNLAAALFSSGQGEYAVDLCSGISMAYLEAALFFF